jgi:bifunctional non-homologous end joining protein LigD
MNRQTVKINKRELSLSNLDKDLFPPYKFTKTRILEYYTHIAPSILPFLEGRALTLKRYPEGVDKDFFFMKHCPKPRPSWVETVEVPYGDKKKVTYCMANNLETLVWVENLASIELHVPLARASSPDNPDSVVFDLDPGDNADILDCARVALILRDLLLDQKLESWVKTSGKKGAHVFAPLDPKKTKFEDTKRFSKAVAEIMQKNFPDLVTARMDKKYRTNRVFINWSQNDASKTMVCTYSLRAMERPTVSFPYPWKEFENLAKQNNPKEFQVLASEAVSIAEKNRDFFNTMLTTKQRLPISWA